MTVTTDQFRNALVSSGLLKPEELDKLLKQLPADAVNADGIMLAKLLVRRGAFTQFQVQKILEGRGAALVFGDYMVTDLIGAGGMGQVFKAHHRRMKREVAIKLLPRRALENPDAVKRFQREVEAAAQLLHPNIVTAFDAGETRGQHYLVMEYVVGHDLASIVKQRGRMPVEQVVNYIAQAARGLAFAHGKGIVHRDVKPANLLVDAAGAVKILDMGLAQFEDPSGEDQNLTQAGQVMGTLDFMAPEQGENTHTADARADVYSLGCSLYFLLTAKPIYTANSLLDKLRAHRDAPIPRLGAERPNVPPALEALYHRMVAKRPEDRVQTMNEVVAALEAIQHGAAASGGAAVVTPVVTAVVAPVVSSSGPMALVNTAGSGRSATVAYAGPVELGENPLSATRPTAPTAVVMEKSKHWLAKIFGGVSATIIAPIIVAFLLRYLDRSSAPPAPTPVPPAAPSQPAGGPMARQGTAQVNPPQALASASNVNATSANANTLASSASPSPAPAPGKAPEPPSHSIDDKPMKMARLLEAPFTVEVAHSAQVAWTRRLKAAGAETNSIGMKLTMIPPGSFTMGSSREVVDRVIKMHQAHATKTLPGVIANLESEAHPHRVTISKPFFLSEKEVTVGQFRRFAEAKKPNYRTEAEKAGADETWRKPGYKIADDLPVTFVSWRDAAEFCNWLSEQEGRMLSYTKNKGELAIAEDAGGYRLPTEAEWEYACRAGTDTLYSFGDNPAELSVYCSYGGEPKSAPVPVGSLRPNPFGLFDMHGNVSEWCQDWFDYTSYTGGPNVDPTGPATGDNRIRRGGNCTMTDTGVRSASRGTHASDQPGRGLGFRVARTLTISAPQSSETHKTDKPNSKPAEAPKSDKPGAKPIDLRKQDNEKAGADKSDKPDNKPGEGHRPRKKQPANP